ncbi:Pentatricopeptide repeat [Dillenia turbinata]|uniref:Pentatricopeptide repeat n=1 Tax=Dillenia turbinata TaxID=194707 RepID=A0AAN8UHX5_9MAGN
MSSLCRRLRRIFDASTSLTAKPPKIPKPKTKPETDSKTKAQKPHLNSSSKSPKLYGAISTKFKELSKEDDIGNSHYRLARRLSYLDKLPLIEDLVQNFQNKKMGEGVYDENYACRLIAIYGNARMIDHAYKLFDELPGRNCKRTVKSLNALLQACLVSKQFDKVHEYFRNLPAKFSIDPDITACNIVLRAYCKMGSLDSAELMLDEIGKWGLDPDVITFNTLLAGFHQNGRFPDVEKIWAKMLSCNIVPNIRTYNARLRGLIRETKMSEAVELFEEMKRIGLEPDLFTFNHLVEVLIPVLCENGEYEFALEMCIDGLNRSVHMDKALLQLVVDRLIKESKIKEAKKLVELGKVSCNLQLTLDN